MGPLCDADLEVGAGLTCSAPSTMTLAPGGIESMVIRGATCASARWAMAQSFTHQCISHDPELGSLASVRFPTKESSLGQVGLRGPRPYRTA